MSTTPATIIRAINPSEQYRDQVRAELHRLPMPVAEQRGSSVDESQLGAATFDLAALPGTTPPPAAFLSPAPASRTEAFAGFVHPVAEVVHPAALSFIFPMYLIHPKDAAAITADLVAAAAARDAAAAAAATAAIAAVAAALPPAKAFGVLLHVPDTAWP